jgi:hypothetical protein
LAELLVPAAVELLELELPQAAMLTASTAAPAVIATIRLNM